MRTRRALLSVLLSIPTFSLAGCAEGPARPEEAQLGSVDQEVIIFPPCPTTLTVPTQEPTIAGALNRVCPGGTITINAGTYYEALTITKDVTLKGSSGTAPTLTNTVVNGVAPSSGISISGDATVTLNNLRVYPNATRGVRGLSTAAGEPKLTVTASALHRADRFRIFSQVEHPRWLRRYSANRWLRSTWGWPVEALRSSWDC